MTSAPIHDRVGFVDEGLAPRVLSLLERPAGSDDRTAAILRHQQLLEAVDRRDYGRLVVWPDREPEAVAHLSSSGTLVVAGAPEAGPHLGAHLASSGWRVLLGDAPVANRLLETSQKGLRRRRAQAREQRFMATSAPSSLPAPDRLRLAAHSDLDVLTEFAARLHVEDQMGPPLSRQARSGVGERMRSSIGRQATWVVERGGEVVAKIDVSLWSRRRGAQIAGVYVDRPWRGHGIAAAGVAAVSRMLIDEGLPGVTLHVRADNPAGRRAYERAGFEDRGPWTLALR